MYRISLICGIVFLAACGDSIAGAGAKDLCATSQGIQVCADRSEYSPNDNLVATVTNTGSESVLADGCSIKAVGKTNRASEFDAGYSPTVQCGIDVDAAEILANMVEIPAGQSVEMAIRIPPFAFQGFYRINVWILDAAGEPVATQPVYSGTFEVFPSAGS